LGFLPPARTRISADYSLKWVIMNENTVAVPEIGKDKLIIETLPYLNVTAGQNSGRNRGIYGVTTDYGDSCTETVPPEHYHEQLVNLTRCHDRSLEKFFDEKTL
jgi:hypothetical protein